jgi:hypothetical protein
MHICKEGNTKRREEEQQQQKQKEEQEQKQKEERKAFETLKCGPRARVTRLGEFRPIGRLLSLGKFFFNFRRSPNFWLHFLLRVNFD